MGLFKLFILWILFTGTAQAVKHDAETVRQRLRQKLAMQQLAQAQAEAQARAAQAEALRRLKQERRERFPLQAEYEQLLTRFAPQKPVELDIVASKKAWAIERLRQIGVLQPGDFIRLLSVISPQEAGASTAGLVHPLLGFNEQVRDTFDYVFNVLKIAIKNEKRIAQFLRDDKADTASKITILREGLRALHYTQSETEGEQALPSFSLLAQFYECAQQYEERSTQKEKELISLQKIYPSIYNAYLLFEYLASTEELLWDDLMQFIRDKHRRAKKVFFYNVDLDQNLCRGLIEVLLPFANQVRASVKLSALDLDQVLIPFDFNLLDKIEMNQEIIAPQKPAEEMQEAAAGEKQEETVAEVSPRRLRYSGKPEAVRREERALRIQKMIRAEDRQSRGKQKALSSPQQARLVSRAEVKKVIAQLGTSKYGIMYSRLFAQPTPDKELTDEDVVQLAGVLADRLSQDTSFSAELFMQHLKRRVHKAHSSDTGELLPRHYVDILRSAFVAFGLFPQGWQPKTREDMDAYHNKYLLQKSKERP